MKKHQTICLYLLTFIVIASDTAVSQNFPTGGYQGANYGNYSTVPATMSLQNVTILQGQALCYNATQTITVAGSGTTFTIASGGSATMIAGQKIDYLPVTKVYSNGYLHGYITYIGQYCIPAKYSAAATEEVPPPDSVIPAQNSGRIFFKVYPNPTSGTFTLEFTGSCDLREMIADIYGMLGDRVSNIRLSGQQKYILSLQGRPVGIYMLRVITGNEAGIVKIVKN
jgi:hypothetical protein